MSLKAVVFREIKQICQSKLAWNISFIIPLVMCLLILIMFSTGTPKHLPIAVLNEDNSEISRLFVRNIEAISSCDVKYKVSNFYEGKKLLSRGEVYGFVVIPRNFQKDIYKLKQPKLLFYYNNQMILIGGIVSKDVTTVVQSLVVGMDAKLRQKRGVPKDLAIKQSNLIAVDDHIRSNPYLNYQYFLTLVSFGHILQINILLTSLWAFGREFKHGLTKEWLKSADDSILIAFLGKLLPYFVIFSILLGILYFIYFVILGAPIVGNILAVIFVTLLFIATVLSLGSVFISINGNFRYGLSNVAFYVAMGFAFAGVTFPVMAMPLLAKIYSAILPLSYYIKIMLNQTLREIPVVYDIPSVVGLFALMAVGFLSLPRLKRLANDESKWYQE